MRRRDLVALVGAAGVWPFAARAQHKSMPVIGILGAGRDAIFDPFMLPFRQGLGETGYVDDQNVAFEYRLANWQFDRMPGLAAELVDLNVDVIVASGGTPWAVAAKHATSTIPIVFCGVGDPVGLGLVTSLARPGGNMTGFSVMTVEMMPKRFDLLFELVPQTKMIALLVNPKHQMMEPYIRSAQEVARARGVQLSIVKADTEDGIDAAFATLSELHVDGLLVGADPFFIAHAQQVAALALRYAVPTIDQGRRFPEKGGLISYGNNEAFSFREAGIYAGRILKGAKPGDLPVQQPSVFELVINLKTAKALGLTVPHSLLARADEVIE